MIVTNLFLYKNKETKIHLHHPLPKVMKAKLEIIDSFGYSTTNLFGYSANIRYIQELLGHSSIKTR